MQTSIDAFIPICIHTYCKCKYMHLSLYTYVHTRKHTHTHMFIRLHIYLYACMHTRKEVYLTFTCTVHAFIPLCIHTVHGCKYMYTSLHTYVHTCTHAYFPTCTCTCLCANMHTSIDTFFFMRHHQFSLVRVCQTPACHTILKLPSPVTRISKKLIFANVYKKVKFNLT